MQKEHVKKCARCCVAALAVLLVMDCFADVKVSPSTRELSEIKKTMSPAMEADGDKSEKATFDADAFIQRALEVTPSTSKDEMDSLDNAVRDNGKVTFMSLSLLVYNHTGQDWFPLSHFSARPSSEHVNYNRCAINFC